MAMLDCGVRRRRFMFFTIRPPPTTTLFPYTTLFRSWCLGVLDTAEDKAALLAELRRVLGRSEEHTSELQSRRDLVCRLLLEKNKPRSQRRLAFSCQGWSARSVVVDQTGPGSDRSRVH